MPFDQSTALTGGPDAASVDLTLALRFDTAAANQTRVLDAAATDFSGLLEDFATVGSVSVSGAAPCPGDCGRKGSVSVSELVRGVSLAIGSTPIEDCPEFDGDGNGSVAVSELVTAVNAALIGCN